MRLHILKRLTLLLLLAAFLPGCSLMLDDVAAEGDSNITLVNRSGEKIYYLALELETAHRSYIKSILDSDESSRSVAANDEVTVDEIGGYQKGDDVRFFVYALRKARSIDDPSPHPGRVAKLQRHLTLTAEDIRRQNGRVVVEEL